MFEIFGYVIDSRIISAFGVSILIPIMGWILKLTVAKDKREKERMSHEIEERKVRMLQEAQKLENENKRLDQMKDYYMSAGAQLDQSRQTIERLIAERDAIREEKHAGDGKHQAEVLQYEKRIQDILLTHAAETSKRELEHQAEIFELRGRIERLEAQIRAA